MSTRVADVRSKASDDRTRVCVSEHICSIGIDLCEIFCMGPSGFSIHACNFVAFALQTINEVACLLMTRFFFFEPFFVFISPWARQGKFLTRQTETSAW